MECRECLQVEGRTLGPGRYLQQRAALAGPADGNARTAQRARAGTHRQIDSALVFPAAVTPPFPRTPLLRPLLPPAPHTSTTYTCAVPVRSLAKATWLSSLDQEGCGWLHCGP